MEDLWANCIYKSLSIFGKPPSLHFSNAKTQSKKKQKKINPWWPSEKWRFLHDWLKPSTTRVGWAPPKALGQDNRPFAVGGSWIGNDQLWKHILVSAANGAEVCKFLQMKMYIIYINIPIYMHNLAPFFFTRQEFLIQSETSLGKRAAAFAATSVFHLAH